MEAKDIFRLQIAHLKADNYFPWSTDIKIVLKESCSGCLFRSQLSLE